MSGPILDAQEQADLDRYVEVLVGKAPLPTPDAAARLVGLITRRHDEGAPGRAPRHCTVPAGRVAERRSTGAA